MAAIDTLRTLTPAARAQAALAAFVTNTIAAVVRWNDARVTRRALAGLTDRELADIGLSRGDIERVTGTW